MRFTFLLLLFLSTQSYAQDNLLLHQLEVLAADSMMGRGYGANDKAQAYIVQQFEDIGISPAFDGEYKQPFEYKDKAGNNIAGIIEGKLKDIIVITAHFDHLGEKDSKIYNGADDNASGTVALFQIASHFLENQPKHTMVIAAVDAEEVGSGGAEYLLNNFPLSVDDIVLNVNLDMIAHNDNRELYACGTYFYPQLKSPLENIKSDIELKFGHDAPSYKGADNWTYASDHRVFHRKEIPFVYFGVEDHNDYHKPSDTFDNINQKFYIKAVDLIVDAIDKLDNTEDLK
ncbi:M28 family peptidase [Fulvivirga sp. RKSG066]|uniref:M28 family peptidase n=1 Tax=Fulvivirga aurantia TaxID=2529383 RepID=UPI0012BC7A90|nr:M28 family peptidase [Fulvivirga aurantia]MTI20686.1 M28 family peptidase [Fulvivirga aurantia]